MTAPAITAKSIFLEVLELSTAAERQAYLEIHCAGDEALRREVNDLLQAHTQVGSFLETPITAVVESTSTLRTAHSPPSLDFLTPSEKPASLGRLGCYEVEEIIGAGGMGIVLRAFDERLHRAVAIKVMSPQLASNEHARRRFIREGRAAAAIRDDHVIGIHGVDETGGLPFLVMEYIVGRSLADRLQAEGPLPVADILRIGAQIARGLAAAHAQGLVHRDIKPANILLENGVERVKITDFGLAHAVDDVRTTQPGTVIGTPEYMSPEQARGERVDHRSDLFSLGCVLYAMCAGRPPFRAESTVAVIRRVCDDTPRPLSEINADIPQWLADLIDRLIAKDPAARFQSAAELADLLEQCLAYINDPVGNALRGVPPPGLEKSLSLWERVAAKQPGEGVAVSCPVSPVPSVRRQSKIQNLKSKIAWPVTAAMLLIAAALALAESTGVTNVAATVIRIVRGDGTLVVEVDDPNIQILLDGDEIAITGAGPKEIRLRPGQHQLQSVKDGKSVETKLVTISRDGREVVKASRESQRPRGVINRQVWPDADDSVGAISPDGQLFAFIDSETGNLAVRDLETRRNRRLTEESKTGVGPNNTNRLSVSAFSHDGRFVSYWWSPPTEPDELRVISIDGGPPRTVFKDTSDNANWDVWGWTPDDTAVLVALEDVDENSLKLILVGIRDNFQKHIVTLPTHINTNLAGILSPDGHTIALSHATKPGPPRELLLIDVATGRQTPIPTQSFEVFPVEWLPDGSGLLYETDRVGANTHDLWLIRVNAGRPNGEPRLLRPDFVGNPQGITRDGTLFYATSTGGSRFGPIGESHIYVADFDLKSNTVKAAELAAEKLAVHDDYYSPTWSNDGHSLAYLVVGPSKESEIRIVSLASDQTRTVRPALHSLVSIQWSPDNQSFLASVKDKESKSISLFRIEAETGKFSSFPKLDNANSARWSSDGKGIFFVQDGAIRLRDLESGNERQILAENAVGLRLSPDGKHVGVIAVEKESNAFTLQVLDLTTETSRELLRIDKPDPQKKSAFMSLATFTPDGHDIVFLYRPSDEEQPGLWSISAEGGEPRKMNVNGLNAAAIGGLGMHPNRPQMAVIAYERRKHQLWALENFLPPLDEPKTAATAATTVAPTVATATKPQTGSTPNVRQVLANAPDSATSLSPDGQFLVFRDSRSTDLALRDLTSGEIRKLTDGSTSAAGEYTLGPQAFSPDGKSIAYEWFNKEQKIDLRVIGIDGGTPRVCYVPDNFGVFPDPLGWIPDGNSIVVGMYLRDRSETEFGVINLADGALRPLKAGKFGHSSLSPDGRFIASTRVTDGNNVRDICLINVQSGEETILPIKATGVLAWAPDGQRLLYALDRRGSWDAWTIRLVDSRPQQPPQLVKPDIGTIFPQGFARDGAFYYTLKFSKLKLTTATLDLNAGTASAQPFAPEASSIMDEMTVGDYSPDGQYLAYHALTMNRGGTIRIAALKTGQVRTLETDLYLVPGWTLRWSPRGESLLMTTPNGDYQIDVETGKPRLIAGLAEDGRVQRSSTVCWSRDGRGLFRTKGQNEIVYQSLEDQTQRAILSAADSSFTFIVSSALEASPDGKYLAVGGRAKDTDATLMKVIPLDGGPGREVLRLNGDHSFAGRIRWSPDGKFIIFKRFAREGVEGGLWYVPSSGGEPRKLAFTGLDTAIQDLAIHPDGKHLAVSGGSPRKSELWALENFLPPLSDTK